MEKLSWENYRRAYYKTPNTPFIRYIQKVNEDGSRQKLLAQDSLINFLEISKEVRDALLLCHNSSFYNLKNSQYKFITLDFVGDLVQRSELDMLRIFGYDNQKLLNLKSALFKYQLALNTRLSESTIEILEDKRSCLTTDERTAYTIPQLFAAVVVYNPPRGGKYKCY